MADDKQRDLPGVVINVEEAVIQTASIQIQMLTIDRRKVTLSLFRQFQKRDVVSRETGELLGMPWGLVNYFWPDCGNESGAKHLHVLWQDADKLYRDCVYSDGSRAGVFRTRSRWYRELARELAWSVVYAVPELLVMQPHDEHRYAVRFKTESRCWYMSDHSGEGALERRLFDWARWGYPRSYVNEHRARTLKDLLDRYSRMFDHKPSEDPTERWAQSFEYEGQAQEYANRADVLEKRWQAEFRKLKGLNQLFIAG